MEVAARELNIGFFSRMTRGMPWVRSKIAASVDGRTALANGTSKWITGEAARRDVQHWRACSCAVLTGIGTVLADDPQLNVREPATERQPLRVVLDSDLRVSCAARILQDGQILIYTASRDAVKQQALRACGAEVALLPGADGKVDLRGMMQDLGRRGINEVLVEAGRRLNGGLIGAGLVDELVLYFAPQLLGDTARGMADLGELTQLQQRVALHWNDVRQVGGDLRIVARISREN
jgi:diaminohydroxyphosphoribosylaminopyrimidine deaminase / 5-amino-6-(5-phosphoribosylamino)uracil reductase